jgi:hypothetical protein
MKRSFLKVAGSSRFFLAFAVNLPLAAAKKLEPPRSLRKPAKVAEKNSAREKKKD